MGLQSRNTGTSLLWGPAPFPPLRGGAEEVKRAPLYCLAIYETTYFHSTAQNGSFQFKKI